MSYFTLGAACSEVEVDVLSGEVVVHRTDILFDAGHSLNPVIDIGQAEGAFVMGQVTSSSNSGVEPRRRLVCATQSAPWWLSQSVPLVLSACRGTSPRRRPSTRRTGR